MEIIVSERTQHTGFTVPETWGLLPTLHSTSVIFDVGQGLHETSTPPGNLTTPRSLP